MKGFLVFCFIFLICANSFALTKGELIAYIEVKQPNISLRTIKLIAEAVFEAGKRYSLDPVVITAIIQVESMFKPTALSRSGACGLMQVKWRIHRDLIRDVCSVRRQLFDPVYGVLAGCKVLISYGYFKDPERAIMRYFGGRSKRAYLVKVLAAIGEINLFIEGLKKRRCRSEGSSFKED